MKKSYCSFTKEQINDYLKLFARKKVLKYDYAK